MYQDEKDGTCVRANMGLAAAVPPQPLAQLRQFSQFSAPLSTLQSGGSSFLVELALSMASNSVHLTVGIGAISAFAWLFYAFYNRRSRIYQLRKQGIVRQRLLTSHSNKSNLSNSQCPIIGAGSLAICWFFKNIVPNFPPTQLSGLQLYENLLWSQSSWKLKCFFSISGL